MNEHRFSQKRCIRTFETHDVLELSKLVESFAKYINTLSTTDRLARIKSCIKGVERNVSKIANDPYMLPYICIANQQKEKMLLAKNKLENKRNGGFKAANTKEIKKLENKLEAIETKYVIRDEEFTVLDVHGFSQNYMYQYSAGRTVKTYAYNIWINKFPTEEVPEVSFFDDVDFTKPIELFINYTVKTDVDIANLDKSFIDMLFNRIWKIDDNIVKAVHRKSVATVDSYADGKVGFYIRNVE